MQTPQQEYALKISKAIVVLGLMTMIGCRGKQMTIVPVDDQGAEVRTAQVSVDGVPIGQGTTQMRAPKTDSSVSVDAAPDYYQETFVVTSETRGPLEVALRRDEIYALTVEDTNKVVNRWLTMAISDQAQDSWWSVVVNAIATQDFEMELMDAKSGFVRTAWKERSFGSEGVRRRFVGNVVTTDPLTWRIKYQVQRTHNGRDWVDYDRGVKAELDVIDEIRGRM